MTAPTNGSGGELAEQIEAAANSGLRSNNEKTGGLVRAHLQTVLSSLRTPPAQVGAATDSGEGVEAETAVEYVVEWEQQWLRTPSPHWGDKIAWQTAHEIAKRLDAALASPTKPSATDSAEADRKLALDICETVLLDRPGAMDVDAAMKVIARHHAASIPSDAELFDALRDESWDLRCFPVPTGGDDADIGWRVVGHWMAEPRERTIAEVYHDDPRAAVREALNLTRARQMGSEGA